MAYLGKEFKFDREENFEAFIKAIASTDASAERFLNYKPNIKLVKNGDEYTMTITLKDFKKDIVFKSGVPFEETVGELTCTSTFTVDGDTFTQVQNYADKGSLTFKREFSADQLKVTMSSTKWDGIATRYYVLA